MKKTFIFLLMLFMVQAKAQTNPITGITISLPANPDANTANWGAGTSSLTITANGKAINGRVDGFVQESKILIIIKKNGSKICGTYTSSTAPASNFNTLTKVWSGSNAVALIGQSCTLPPGDYELSVQFFGYSNAKTIAFSDEKTKAFTIRGNEQQSYQAPQAIAPANETIIKENDLLKPITFRWTPVIPCPQEPVTYRIRVWQLMQGQNSMQARTLNQPIFTKDIDNLTQTTVSNLYTGPCKLPYLCDFAWSVQAINREGKPIGGNNGASETFVLKYAGVTTITTRTLKLISPANHSTVNGNKPLRFSWISSNSSTDNTQRYKIRIVEITADQSPEQALRTNKPIFEKDTLEIRTNKPHFEKDSLQELTVNAPFMVGKKYAWAVGSASPSMFYVGSCDVNLSLKLRSVECLPDVGRNKRYKINFSSTYSSSSYNLTYTQTGSGLTAYHPSYSPNYTVNNISPVLQSQNSGTSTTINYAFEVSVPIGQTAIKIGLQGDDKDPGPITCKPGAELDVTLPICTVPTCDCGKWGDLNVKMETPTGSVNRTYKCGSGIVWKCNQAFSFSSSYLCSQTVTKCEAKTSWEIKKDGLVIKTGSGTNSAADTFTPTSNGTYTITLNADCGDKKCPPCTYIIKVEDCKIVTCDCGAWRPLLINGKSIECGSKLDWNCNKAFTYQCSITDASCKATTRWTIRKDGKVVQQGTGTNSIKGSFTPTTNGTYTLILDANCGEKECKSCTYTFVVKDCKTVTCDCGTWGLLKIKTVSVGPKGILPPPLSYKCGSKIAWRCNKVLSFSNTYKCNTTDANCEAKTSWEIKKDDLLIKSGNGLNNSADTFKPTENGVYTLTLKANCGGKDCQPCTYTFVVEDCRPVLSCVTPPKDMVAWWTFDEKAGQPLVDRAGVNNIGTGINNPLSVPAKVVGGLKFDGINNYVDVPDHAELNFGAGDFSFDAWIQTSDTRYLQDLVDKRTTKGYLIYLVNGKLGFLIRNGSTTNYSSPLFVADGKWHHIAITVSRNNKNGITFYLDGVPTQFGDPTLQLGNIDNTSPLRIGKDLYSSSYNFKGILDEIELFNRVLTKDEVVSIYKADKAGKCKDAAQVCDCGKWGPLQVRNAAGGTNYDCGTKKAILWNCNKAFDFATTYQCSKSDASCTAKTRWTIRKDGKVVQQGTGTNSINGSFTPTANGMYTITLDANCGGKDCQPCTYTFVVEDCRPVLSCVTPPKEMVAWWTFDEKAGQPLVDRAGVNNIGTGINNPLSVPAKVAGGLKFNGINNYVAVPNHAELNFGTGDFSFDTWIQTDDVKIIKPIIDKRSISIGYSIFLYKGKLSIQLNDSGPNTNYISPLFVADGKWHHIAITVARKDQKGIVFYLDGVPTQLGDPTLRPGNIDNTEPLLIARSANDEDNNGNKIHFKGILDEIELFNRVLTKEEIVSIYKADKAGKCKINRNGM